MTLRSDADTSRMPVVCAHGRRRPGDSRRRRRNDQRCTTRSRPWHTSSIQADAARRSRPASKPYSRNDRGDALVVDGRVRVDPVALRIDRQRQHLRQVRPLEQELLPRHQAGQQVQLHLVQLKQLGVLPAIERRVRQQQLRRAALDDRAEQVGRGEVVDRLRRQEHRGVPLAPGLERLLHVGAQRRVLDEAPRLVHHAQLQRAPPRPGPGCASLTRWRT